MLLTMHAIEKSFPGVKALSNGRLELEAGEVHALLGENGAGKSTLIKVLSGAHRPDAGKIEIDGEPVRITSPAHAQRLGIAVIYQEFNLVPALSARENIFLGRERTRAGFFAQAEETCKARELFARLNVKIDPEEHCRNLTVAQQQCVEIAKALSQNARIIVMDEPTAALTSQEVEQLFRIIRQLQTQGIGIVYISHRLDEVFAIAQRATVMRDGAWVDTRPVPKLSRAQLIEMMVGRALDREFPSREVAIGSDRLRVRNLRRGSVVKDVSFSVRRGEVLGLTGLIGAGRTEVARMIFGADRADGGEVELDGRILSLRSPREAIRNGICLVTEDRKAQGLVLALSVRENFSLPNLRRLSVAGFVRHGVERGALRGYIESLQIKTPHSEQLARNLSGGTQQKVVLAKWLFANAEVVIIDEPTRGIDVGAKFEIYTLINKLAAEGKAILMISSELPEVLGMSDRVLVMHEGRITGEIQNAKCATQEQIMELAHG
ncbi:MAG TPA: sugar ABC transporter ATP-binding protein [Planctomycetota bacterium]|jgi:ABC-type sugar transport system ATPase subunit